MKTKLISTKDPKKVPKTLRQKSKEVIEITPDILDLAKQMIEIMNKNNGIGLAAIQVGVPICLIVIKDGEKEHILINPKLRKVSKAECSYNEGCLSFPELFKEVMRPERVVVRAETVDEKTIEIDAGGILARVLQHEIDHTNGIVFIDHIKDFDKNE